MKELYEYLGLFDESYLNKMSIKTDIEKDFSNKVEIQKDFVQANVINQSNYKSTNDKIVAKKFNLNNSFSINHT